MAASSRLLRWSLLLRPQQWLGHYKPAAGPEPRFLLISVAVLPRRERVVRLAPDGGQPGHRLLDHPHAIHAAAQLAARFNQYEVINRALNALAFKITRAAQRAVGTVREGERGGI